MSLMSMRRAAQKYGAWIWVPLVLALVITAFMGFGANLSGVGQDAAVASETTIATVGDLKVTRTALDRQVDQALQQQRAFMPNPSPLDVARTRLFLLDQYKQQQALVAAAEKAGVSVTDADIDRIRDEAWNQERAGYLAGLGLKENATDAELNRALSQRQTGLTVDALKQQYPEEQLRISAYAQKLQDQFKKEARAKATEKAVRDSYSDIQVRHVLIKFGEGALPEAQAREKAQKILDAAKKDPSQLAKLARENSDDPGSKATGGFYDWSPASRYVPAFTEAALSVKPGQVYPELVRVSTPGYSGFHIVKLEGIRTGSTFPKDFDKNKQKYIDEYVNTVANQMTQEAMAAALPAVKVTVEDPTLRAVQLQNEAAQAADQKAREAKLNQALAELAKVPPADDPSGIVPLMKAAIYESLDKPKEAIAAYRDALKANDSVEARLSLAQQLLATKDKAGAVTQLQEAEKMIRGEIQSQFRLASLYRQAGRADLAKAADKKAQEMLERQAAMNKAGGVSDITVPPAAGTDGAAAEKPEPGG